MTRYGSVIHVKDEKLEEYKSLHASVWPEVLDRLRKCNIKNYSIFYRDGYLFSYFEYTGDDYTADLAIMAEDPRTQEWWSLTDPCQYPVKSALEGEWWASMDEVFHLD
ncbi:L-rhamnose mutarotase [Paenibacillus sp. FSL H7-0714]|uniref:L-rhamnose mutarotase n=1 Tax=Paenibacillus sp. FSL H7-0714 TaxID=2954735 RepID=UPI0030F7F5D8